MTDQEILKLIRENKYDPAIKKLYAYYPVIKKFVLQSGGTRHEAEDVFQEGLVIFCNKIANPAFVLHCSVNTYLYSVCKLLWFDELKRKRKAPKIALTEITDEHLFADDIEQDKPIKQAQEAINKLGQKCKELLELFYFKKLKMADIAKQLGFASEKVAKNQKYRCLEKARQHFNPSF